MCFKYKKLCNIINIDFPDVISVRKKFIVEQDREKNIECDLKDFSWMKEIDGSNGVIFLLREYFITLEKMK